MPPLYHYRKVWQLLNIAYIVTMCNSAVPVGLQLVHGRMRGRLVEGGVDSRESAQRALSSFVPCGSPCREHAVVDPRVSGKRLAEE